MTLKSSSIERKNPHRARPALEGLEERQLLSWAPLASTALAAASSGVFSQDNRVFSYTTPTGGHATIKVVGLGNLIGTTLSTSPGSVGALELVYGDTNAYSKITGKVHGGGGHAPLESIQNSELIAAGAQNSLNGIGGDVAQSFLLSPFDLINGGRINLTPGVNSLILNSIGADTQVNIRALPPAPSTSTTVPTSSLVVGSTSAGATNVTVFRAFATTATTSNSANGTTLEALQSTTVTNPYNQTTTYVSNGNGSQTLTSAFGEFTSAGNIVEPLPTAQPPQTVPAAPPGVILKVNQINGVLKKPVNVQKDAKIFGYDPTTGQVVLFDLDLDKKTADVDPNFAPINLPGPVPNNPPVAGLDLAWNGPQLDVLVSQGTTVYAFNATTGAADGSFSTISSFMNSVPINSIAGTDTLTVLGSYQTNTLYAINLPLSLQDKIAQPADATPPTFAPMSQFTLLGGLASAPGANSVFAAIAGHFDTTQPAQTQLGEQEVDTAGVAHVKGKGSVFGFGLNPQSNTGIQLNGAFVNVVAGSPTTMAPGPALGSIDQTLALVTGASGGTNTVNTESSTFTFHYADLLAGLSRAFRPDLAGSALIDIQGTVQSIRGGTATGMVLNDTGNLNLVKFASVTNSTIVGQPVGHIQFQKRSNVLIQTPKRTVGSRNGVKIEKHLKVIGPLSQPNDKPVSDY